jgi:hypothetical protein
LYLVLGSGRAGRQGKHDCGDCDPDACPIVGCAAGKNESADRQECVQECVQHAILPCRDFMKKVDFF